MSAAAEVLWGAVPGEQEQAEKDAEQRPAKEHNRDRGAGGIDAPVGRVGGPHVAAGERAAEQGPVVKLDVEAGDGPGAAGDHRGRQRRESRGRPARRKVRAFGDEAEWSSAAVG